MLKKELREQGYSITEHCQKHTTITLIWVVSAAVMIAAGIIMAWVSKNKKALAAAIIFLTVIAIILKIVVL